MDCPFCRMMAGEDDAMPSPVGPEFGEPVTIAGIPACEACASAAKRAGVEGKLAALLNGRRRSVRDTRPVRLINGDDDDLAAWWEDDDWWEGEQS